MMAELCDLPTCRGLTFTCVSVVNVFLFTYFGMHRIVHTILVSSFWDSNFYRMVFKPQHSYLLV